MRDVAGFDDCLDHYDENILRLIRAANRDGYQVVFDNVGGTLLDAALFNIAVHARVVLCGSISTGYKPQRPDVGLLLPTADDAPQPDGGLPRRPTTPTASTTPADLLRWSDEGGCTSSTTSSRAWSRRRLRSTACSRAATSASSPKLPRRRRTFYEGSYPRARP